MKRMIVILLVFKLLFLLPIVCYGTEATPTEPLTVELEETAPSRTFRTTPTVPSAEIRQIRTERVILIAMICLAVAGVIVLTILWNKERKACYDTRCQIWEKRDYMHQKATEPKYTSLWSIASLIIPGLAFYIGFLALPSVLITNSMLEYEDLFFYLLSFMFLFPVVYFLSLVLSVVGKVCSKNSITSTVAIVLNVIPVGFVLLASLGSLF